MNVYHTLEVKDDDAVGAWRRFLLSWWELLRFDVLLTPVETTETPGVALRIIKDKAGLAAVNPFAPLMPINSAGLLNQLVMKNPNKSIAAIMRPCELRTFFELRKRQTRHTNPEKLVLIGLDCPGTYSTVEYKKLVRSRSQQEVTRESLKDAACGGLRAQSIRTACLVCECPAPLAADLVIGTIGVPTGQLLLLICRDEATSTRLNIDKIVEGKATEYQASHREALVGAMANQHVGMRKTLTENLPGVYRFDELGSFFAWLAGCSLCGKCLQACPLYDIEFEGVASMHKDHRGERALLSELVHLSRWLASCSGCGMCAQYCLQEVPFSLLIASISHHIRQEMGYTPGDPDQVLPWAQSIPSRGTHVLSKPNS